MILFLQRVIEEKKAYQEQYHENLKIHKVVIYFLLIVLKIVTAVSDIVIILW